MSGSIPNAWPTIKKLIRGPTQANVLIFGARLGGAQWPTSRMGLFSAPQGSPGDLTWNLLLNKILCARGNRCDVDGLYLVRVGRRAQASAGSAAWSLLRRDRERRVLAGALVDEPPLPFGGVVGPLHHLDAPCRRFGGQVDGLALGGRQAARDNRPGLRH